MIPLNRILYDTFEKNGSKYECTISTNPTSSDDNKVHFGIVLKIPRQPTYLHFLLRSSGDGHWIPSEKTLVDPWMADAIGKIILENF